MDPALPGAQHFPAASALEHVRWGVQVVCVACGAVVYAPL
jgi:hypothetical protein